MNKPGNLFVLPGLLGDDAGAEWLCGFEISLIKTLRLYFVENERSARRFIRKAGFEGDLNEIQLFRLDKNTKPEFMQSYLQLLEQGHDGAVLSEAGMPALADPGASLIISAHKKNIRVVPVPGPSAIMLAIVTSGLNGQQFSFNGYLPIEMTDKAKTIRKIEDLARNTGYAQFFIETPYRNNRLLNDILTICKPDTLLSIAANLCETNGWNKTQTIDDWKKEIPELHKIPAVFGLGLK
jgi:16S rRNA (cytidine1402-2'-O)-methyltransferase